MEERSFEAIHDEYAFFLAHSDEPVRCREAMVRELRSWDPGAGRIRLLDFGCSRGEFLAGVLADWAVAPERLDVAAVDIDASALPAARAAVGLHAGQVRSATAVEGVSGGFDAILSNHVLYYAGDPTGVVRGLFDRLAPGGLMLLLLGGRGNRLCDFWDAAYDAGRVPWHRADDVEAAVASIGAGYRRVEIPSRLEFPDSPGNRMRILRFLFSSALSEFDVDSLLTQFERHRSADRIVIDNRDELFVVGKS